MALRTRAADAERMMPYSSVLIVDDDAEANDGSLELAREMAILGRSGQVRT